MSDSKRKLIIISLSSGFGGGEKWCSGLAKSAGKVFEPLTLPFVKSVEDTIEDKEILCNWCGWSRSTLNNLLHLRKITRSFECTLQTIKPAVVVCATWPAALLCLYLKSQQRFPWKLLIVFHRQVEEVFFRSSWFGLLVPFKLFFFIRYLKLADKLVVLNTSSQNVIKKWINNQPIVIPNGVDVEKVHNKSLADNSDNLSKPYIVFIGRFEREKGIERLVKAFSLLHESKINMVLVGAGTLECRLKKMVSDLNLQEKVTFHGYTKNPFPILKDAAVLTVPSPWECQSLVVLEAFALGVPVVAVDNPGMRDLLGNGSRGVLCDGNLINIASALREVLNGGIKVKLQVAAGKDYAEKHDEHSMYAHYLKIMEEITQ